MSGATYYIAFISAVIMLYVFNLFVINPITCFFQEGCCFEKQQLGEDEETKPGQDTNASMTKQAADMEEQEQASLTNIRLNLKFEIGSTRPSNHKTHSENFYSEVSFEALHNLLQDGIDDSA